MATSRPEKHLSCTRLVQFSFLFFIYLFFLMKTNQWLGVGLLIATNSSSHLLANPSSALPFAKTKLPNQNTIDPLPSNMYLHNNNNPLENVLITSFLLFVHNRFISLTLQSRHREPRTPPSSFIFLTFTSSAYNQISQWPHVEF